MFVASAIALGPSFASCALAGAAAAKLGSSPAELLEELRPIGKAAEKAMNSATGGVNTHKGAIFCLGLLSAAMAHVHERGMSGGGLGDAACECVSDLCAGLVEKELAKKGHPRPLTAGERLFRELGTRGARGQAEDGYPLLRTELLPVLRGAASKGSRGYSIACLDVLLLSMSTLEDSCLLARGGVAGLTLAQRGAHEVLSFGGAGSERGMNALRSLDARLCAAGLSPGGSADLVAAGIFLARAEASLGKTAYRQRQAQRIA